MANQQTKAERREAAREKARKLQELEEKRAKRNKLITIIVIVVAIALVGVAIWSIVANGSDDEEDAMRQEYDPVAVQVEPVTIEGADVPTGFSVLGEDAEYSEDAQRVEIYFDYMCIHCNNLEQWNGGDLNEITAQGDAEIFYYPVAIMNNDISVYGAATFQYIAENSPEHLMAYHKNLFDITDAYLYNREAVRPDWDSVKQAARDAGVSDDVVDSLESEVDLEWVNAANQQFSANGFTGTPTVLLNGEVNYEYAENDFPAMLGLAEPEADTEE